MEKGVITLLDVLGWSGIWQRKSDAVYELKQLLNNIDHYIKLYVDSSIEVNQTFAKDLKIEYRSISDTIAIITFGPDPTRAIVFQSVINSLLIADSISRQIPLRGATSYGQFTIQDNILVGPAVDEVASWYETSDSIGAFLTPSALLCFDAGKKHFKEEILVREEVKIKGMGSYNTYFTNWPIVWSRKRKTILTREDLINAFLSMGPLTPHIAKKYLTSLDFYDRQHIFIETMRQVAVSNEEKI